MASGSRKRAGSPAAPSIPQTAPNSLELAWYKEPGNERILTHHQLTSDGVFDTPDQQLILEDLRELTERGTVKDLLTSNALDNMPRVSGLTLRRIRLGHNSTAGVYLTNIPAKTEQPERLVVVHIAQLRDGGDYKRLALTLADRVDDVRRLGDEVTAGNPDIALVRKPVSTTKTPKKVVASRKTKRRSAFDLGKVKERDIENLVGMKQELLSLTDYLIANREECKQRALQSIREGKPVLNVHGEEVPVALTVNDIKDADPQLLATNVLFGDRGELRHLKTVKAAFATEALRVGHEILVMNPYPPRCVRETLGTQERRSGGHQNLGRIETAVALTAADIVCAAYIEGHDLNDVAYGYESQHHGRARQIHAKRLQHVMEVQSWTDDGFWVGRGLDRYASVVRARSDAYLDAEDDLDDELQGLTTESTGPSRQGPAEPPAQLHRDPANAALELLLESTMAAGGREFAEIGH